MTLNFSSLFSLLFTLSSILSAPAARAEIVVAAVEPGLLESLSTQLFECSEQPYGFSARSGNVVFGQLRSRCDTVVASQDRVQISRDGRSYTFVTRDSALSDGGDLNDLYVQYDGREDQEELVATDTLSFGDPALSILLITGRNTDELPRILDTRLNLSN